MSLYLVAILAIFLFSLVLKKIQNKSLCPPPGPKALPIIGNFHQFDPSKPAHIFFANLAKIYGPILSLRLGNRTMVVIQSPKIAKEFYLAQDNNYRNRYVSLGSQKFSYNGLGVVFAPYGEDYRELKKLFVVHLLSSKRVQSVARIRQEEVSRFMHKVASLSASSKIVNLSELAISYTTSNICRIAFGKRYEDEVGSKSKFHDLLNEAQALFADVFFTDHFPLVGPLLDRLAGKHYKLEKTFKKLDDFYEEVLNDHLKKPKSEEEDIIDILLQLKKEGSFGFELTMDHIKATLMDIFVAGTDTTAAMVVWAMTELMKNPNTMKKVQSELRSVIQNKSHITEEDLSNNLEYFKAVVKETFRLHPPGPLLIPRESLQKSNIGGYDIQPKSIITINLWALGRDPESWNNPNIFTPERFLGSSKSFLGQNFELLPFGAGKRMCPGLNFGIASLELVLANLLYCFDWELPHGLKREDIDTDVQLGVIMHKKNPLCLVANKVV